MYRILSKSSFRFNKYNPKYFYKWGLSEQDYTRLLGKLKLWFILHPTECSYCKYCKLYNSIDCEKNHICCIFSENGKETEIFQNFTSSENKYIFCLTWLLEGNYVVR